MKTWQKPSPDATAKFRIIIFLPLKDRGEETLILNNYHQFLISNLMYFRKWNTLNEILCCMNIKPLWPNISYWKGFFVFFNKPIYPSQILKSCSSEYKPQILKSGIKSVGDGLTVYQKSSMYVYSLIQENYFWKYKGNNYV